MLSHIGFPTITLINRDRYIFLLYFVMNWFEYQGIASFI